MKIVKKAFAFLAIYCVLSMAVMIWWRVFSAKEPPFNVSDFYTFHGIFSAVGIGGWAIIEANTPR